TNIWRGFMSDNTKLIEEARRASRRANQAAEELEQMQELHPWITCKVCRSSYRTGRCPTCTPTVRMAPPLRRPQLIVIS
ncbi:MAG TPA: hypothetical protein VIY48_02305, partial [Candidatus Paceibacterota bacterium]